MNEMKVFNNERFGEVRTISINGEPWFVGKDVAEILGYSDTFGALKNTLTTTTSKTAKIAVLKVTED